MNNIGNKLKELREQNGLTRKEAVDKLHSIGIDISDKTLYGYESGRNSANADMFLSLCKIYDCNNIMATFYDSVDDVLFTNKEWKLIEMYRALDLPGQEHINTVLDWESTRTQQLKKQSDCIADLEAQSAAVIDIQPYRNSDQMERITEYFRSVSVGGGVFILGNETSAKIIVSESDWDERADYVIGVIGDSMEPDFHDGDNVLVSQRMEIHHGDVGIFIVNGKAYIKEYGETELISRNPDAGNIKICEYDNIVCMGKVIGRIEGPYEIIDD